MGLSRNLWQLSLSYGIMVGLAKGAAGLVIISLLVAKHYQANRRGLAVSVIQTASPLSPVFFSPLLYFLIERFDWRVASLASGVLLLAVAFPLGWLGARDPNDVAATRRNRPAKDGSHEREVLPRAAGTTRAEGRPVDFQRKGFIPHLPSWRFESATWSERTFGATWGSARADARPGRRHRRRPDRQP